jgi:hypothetical protein
VIDNLARSSLDSEQDWGMLEPATMGRHDPMILPMTASHSAVTAELGALAQVDDMAAAIV